MRHDGRKPDQLRPFQIIRGFTQSAPGSVVVAAGRTKVLCTASITDDVPDWRKAGGAGWLTAEYDMLPGSTQQRRERKRTDGRTQEIQRLIGRSLRACVDLARLGPRTIYLDCDVLEADGGTRTAAVTGAYVALCDAIASGVSHGFWGVDALTGAVAAVSVGMVDGIAVVDLDYAEDVRAQVDCNLVMTRAGAWIEVQATAERAPFDDAQLAQMTALGRRAIDELFEAQRRALEQPLR